MKQQTTSRQLEVLGDPGRLAAVLSPIRRKILEQLGNPESASGLSRKLGLPRQKLNYHLRELEREGFVELAETRKRRGLVERRLRATARAFLIDPALLGILGANPEQVQDRFSSTYLIAVAARMVHDATLLRERAARAKRPLATLTLQTDVSFRSPAERTAFAEELAGTIARLAAKYNDDSPGSRRFRFVVGGHPVITRTDDNEDS